MQNNQTRGVAALTLALCMLPPAVARAESTAASLTRIEAETMLLRAREKQLEVQSSIITKQNEIAAKQTMGAMLSQPVVVGDPVVRAVEGLGDTMFATLEMSNGSVAEVQVGSVLPGGMRIVSIQNNEVMASAPGRKRVRLSGYTQQVNAFNPGTPAPLPVAAAPRSAR
ncbi:type IV pilus biogenesis protein PilP [Duganella sp. CF458]|uniref:type IV pilus biogenesis protein PilP n=1 Tax=Duganella sp. CF458 TaxID=1884368 RepID=UPI0008EB2E40|nr:type IV pilus biogenesis protein PilP [Duganella sp. CF458]SFF95909.1 type IV pilus biogenesis protein PilP [Duganella sp. CF458]